MLSFTKNCAACSIPFVVDEADQAFYAKINVPAPSQCPDCRQRRRMSFRNERNFYYRKCDLCSKQIISIYHADSPYTVYCNACWWSDKWDPMTHGQNVDFDRPFFEQFKELQVKIPRMALYQKNSENCDYTNHSEKNKDCYICVDTANSQDVFYSKWILGCRDCADSYNIEKSELSYSAQYEVGSFNVVHTFYSDYCSDSAFLYNCERCQNCFMCSHLSHKEYCVYNKQLSKEEYEAFMKTVDLGSHAEMQKYYEQYTEMIRKAPKRAAFLTQCENCTGDCIYQCKNVQDSFDIIESEDVRYSYESAYLKDCYDVYESAFDCELQYECHGCNRGKFLRFAHVSYDMDNCSYVDSCHNSSNLFGCLGLRHKKYCILNKEYSKEAYGALVVQLVEHMKKTGEWGEFFPPWLSPFAYNETIANEYFPLQEEQATAWGYTWKKETEEAEYQGAAVSLPDHVNDAMDEVTKQILKCEKSGKFYRIIPQELALYRKMGIALPRCSPQQRYMDRLGLRNVRHLWEQNCSVCGIKIRAPYLPDSGQRVYCEECYLKLKY